MSIVKKYNELLDLDEIDVLIDEVDKSRHIIVSDFPDSLPQGKSSFLIELSPFMKDGVEIQMDFIDNEGASIYLEPVSEYLEGTARRVSAEIYSDTAPGIATLIIVGELESVPDDATIFSDVDPVPVEYQGAYNIRLTKQVVINPTAVNTQIIKFFDQPRINVTEIRKGTMVRSESTASITSALFDVEGVPTDTNLLFKPYGAIDSDIQQGSGGTTSPKKQRNIKAFIESKKRKNKKGLRKNSAFKRSGLLSKTNSPATFPYQLQIGEFDGSESFRFNTSHIGAVVRFFDSGLGNTFSNSNFYPTATLDDAGLNEPPTFDTLKEQGVANASASMYTASIVDLVNDKTALVELPFTNKNNNGENIILPIFSRARIEYENMPTGSYKADNLVSYADVKLSNMKTFSGDVYKVKVYVKSEGGFDDYKLLSEVPLESKELLVDTDSVGQSERTGYFILQSEIDKYWSVSGSVDGETVIASPSTNAAYSNSTILDAVELSSSLADSDDSKKHLSFQLKDKYKFNMVGGMEYSISFNAVGKKASSKKEAVLLVYVSGSSMKQQDKLYFDEQNSINIPESSKYGKRIGALRIKSGEDDIIDFGLVNQTFANDTVGDGILQFRVLSGIWNISDMSISPAGDTGFSPSFFQFSQQLPAELSHKRPDTFEFLAEFYDINNNIADTVAYLPGVLFDGANMSISGKDNVLESNMFIGGGNTASGMHLGGVTSTLPETGKDGATGSGFMRSVGYQGFISASAQSGSYGFMIYSGSVLPDSGDDYKGVGLELVGASGSLKFRTNPSLFEVQADAFFVGKKSTQFISGSGGNVEISSSDFHLTPEGNVTASAILLGDKGGGNYLQFLNNTLTVVGNLSVNNLFLPATIGGATSDVTNASSSLSSDGFAKFVSASIGGWEVNTTTIKSPGDNLQLQSNNKRFAVYDTAGTPKERIRIGEVDGGSVYGMKIFDGTGTDDSDILVELGEGGNNLAGWTIGTDTIQGGNLILGKDGSIKSADYVSDFSGFIITAEENGYAEFENCKIRGTMATTTFEKESVNAVGGQLFVANSAALSGSAVAATEVSMSLKNVTGFAKGEVLLIKKVTDTGFNTEYVQVISSSRVNAGGDSDPDGLAGNIFVQRGNGFYTRKELKYYGADESTYLGFIGFRSSNTDPVVVDLKFNSGTTSPFYQNGTNTGIHVSGSHVSSGSFYVNVTGNVTQVGDGTSLSLRLLNNTDSDSIIGTLPFWKTADGTGLVEKELYFPSGVATGSRIKMQVVGVTDSTNDAFLKLEYFTASLDYGSIGSVGTGDSGSVGDPIGGPTDYTEGQVVVSTGRYISGTGNNTVGTGYIRLNANPKNQATPYMDIVERTGSGIYDVELKARLGDLSGVAGTRNVPAGFQGFGLMSEVAFLSGSNIKLEAPTFVLGDLNKNFVSGSNGNLEISSSKFHMNSKTEKFFIGQPNKTGSFVDFQGSAGTLAISASNFELTADGQITASSMKLKGISVVDDVAVADYFAFRFIEITTSNVDDYMEEFTTGGKVYWRLMLDGSLGGDIGAFVKLTNLDALSDERPIAQIVPPSQNNARATGVPPQTGAGSGHRIVIEAKNQDVYFAKNISDAATTYDSNGYLINATSNHMTGFAFQKTHTVSSVSYTNVMKVANGGTIDLIKSEDSWFIHSLSALTDIGLQSPGEFALFNVDGDSSFAGSGGVPFAPFVFAGDQTSYLNGTMFISGNPTVRRQDDSTVASSHSSYSTASIGMQSGTGHVYFMGPTHNDARMSFGLSTAAGGNREDNHYPISTTAGGQVYIRDNLYLAGSVGTAVGTPAQRLYIEDNSTNAIVIMKNNTTNDAAELLELQYVADEINSSGHPIIIKEEADGTADIIYEVRGDGSGGSTVGTSFTGGHDNVCEDDDDLMPGLIVETTGHMWAHPTGSYETALPFTKLCQTNGSKKVFGVINGYKPAYISGSLKYPEYAHFIKNGWQMKPEFTGTAKRFPTGSGNFHLHTNSIGEGSVWVTNVNGEIENGDFVESSVIKGYGRKQDDDIMRSKTIAKVTENIDWDNISDTITFSGSAYKKHKAAVTFHCG
jgi:hypothetical protein